MATALVAVAVRAVGGPATLAALRRADPAWLAAAAACHAAIIPLWAWQTWLLLPRRPRARAVAAAPAGAAPGGAGAGDATPTYGRLCEVQALSSAAANTVPAFLGQAAGVAVLAERGGVGAAVALGVFAQHNLLEGVAKLAVLGAATRVAPLPPKLRAAAVVLVAGTAVLLALLAAAAWAGRRASHARPGVAAEPGAGRAGALLARAAASLDALRDPRRLAPALAAALLMKGAEGSGWWAVERAFGVAPRPGSPVLALAATNLASAVPAAPGNLGVYEGAAYAAYHVVLGVAPDTAAALAVAGHAALLLPLVGVGWVVLSIRQLAAWRARRARQAARARGGGAV